MLFPKDGSSLSNPNVIQVTHMDWTIDVDFDAKILHGIVTYTLKYNTTTSNNASSILQLDTSNLNISKVVSVNKDAAEEELSYELRENNKQQHLGSQLCITLLSTEEEDKREVRIYYKTTPQSSAIQFLDAAQTAGKKHPYLFTQCQAIHARSLLPCQDRPGVKATYTARVTVPSWATCVMSAVEVKTTEEEIQKKTTNDDDDKKVYRWEQRIPISSYLIAMAVGELDCRTVSDRCRVWSEPSVVDAAAYDFQQTEEFLQIAEELSGIPYVWGRYDLLCLVPSFPFGGMENPCLTFVTPTLLTGDRSLADVVAHEIAHSWTGNLVTNATWDHFWLNEGWTTWFQRKIMARIHKSDQFFDFDAIGGYKTLQDTVSSEGLPTEFKSLVLDIQDRDPDDAYSSIAYEKGFNLLYTLEQRVGTKEFEAFFRAYLSKYQSQTITSEEFRTFFMTQFNENETVKDFDWDTWLYKPGMPPTKPNFDHTLAEESQKLAVAWYEYDNSSNKNDSSLPNNNTKVNLKEWSSDQIICFLDTLLEMTTKTTGDDDENNNASPLSISTLTSMKELYELDKTCNSEILFRFCQLCIKAEDQDILPIVIRFITTQGRMKFTRPLYRALYTSKMASQLAVDTFLQHSTIYHPICTKMIASDLSISSEEEQKKKKNSNDGTNAKGTTTTTTLVVVAAAIVSIAIGVLAAGKRRR